MSDGSDHLDLRQILSGCRVGDLSYEMPPVLAPGESVEAAAAAMRTQGHGSVLVCAEDRLAGIFTERDLLRAISSGQDLRSPLWGLMTTQPETVTTDEPLLEVIRRMDAGGYRRMPVVDGENAPTGVVDIRSIVHYLVQHFPAAVYNQASHAQRTARHREGA